MDPSHPPARPFEVVIPKNTSSESSTSTPPPAYTPRRAMDIPTLLANGLERLQARRMQPGGRIDLSGIRGRTVQSVMLEDQDAEDTDDGSSPICLRINTAVNISNNNNLVCLTETPAEHANAIARAVVESIQKNSAGHCGIPMIDEDGHPRPLKIEVDAGMVVDGSENVVGNKDIIEQVLRQRGEHHSRRLRAPTSYARAGHASASAGGLKRGQTDEDSVDASESDGHVSPAKRRLRSQ